MAPGVDNKHLPSQENLLLDYLRRLEDKRAGRRAVYIMLSGLKPFNRREQHIRAASSSFESLIQSRHGQLFCLKNSDLFFAFKAEATPHAEAVVRKIRFLFSDDPFLEEENTDKRRFVTWHDMEKDYDALLLKVQDAVEAEHKRATDVHSSRQDARTTLKARQEQGEPLTPDILWRVEKALGSADLSNLVRRQFVCSFDSKHRPEPFFSELFISIADLRETVIPGVNVTSNQWLFQHLTKTLDRRMLAMLGKTDHITISGDISFNLNVETLVSDEFLAFDDNITAGRRGTMIIELQMMDIFANLSAFVFARKFVQDKGYRVCIDGLNRHTIEMIGRKSLEADILKIAWNSELLNSGGEVVRSKLRRSIEKVGKHKTILCRVDSREAVNFGRAAGAMLFQGRYIESLIAEDNRRKELLRLRRRIERSRSF